MFDIEGKIMQYYTFAHKFFIRKSITLLCYHDTKGLVIDAKLFLILHISSCPKNLTPSLNFDKRET